MRIDFSPLYRSTVGFDRLFSLMDTIGSGETSQPNWPPYDIARTDENAWRITMAVAGFGEAELGIELEQNVLTVKGAKETRTETGDYLYRGIAARSFERRFQLADHMIVRGARLENGLLHIDLVREIPETLKSRRIPIATATETVSAQPIEAAPASPAIEAAPTVAAA
jgi:molecular chaperone IbpA